MSPFVSRAPAGRHNSAAASSSKSPRLTTEEPLNQVQDPLKQGQG